jgi:type IV pilus assembly protein PilB
VRYQVGHGLEEAMRLPEQAGKHLVSQLKTLAQILPVARAQEGKFKVEKDGEVVNVRVHSLPTQDGEHIHMRLARETHGAKGYTLESLGFHGEALERVEKTLHTRRGVIAALGYGKTTMIRTLEDMVRAPHIVTIEAYAATLRAALKHDPDVLVIDDIADVQTATLVGAAGERGVLVLAAEAGEIVPTENGIRVQQSLVRRLCTKSFADMKALSRAQQDALAPYVNFVKILTALKDEGVIDKSVAWKDVGFAHATACSECKGGYQGRIGLQEVSDPQGFIGLNIVEDGLFKAAQGLTSVEEVLALVS